MYHTIKESLILPDKTMGFSKYLRLSWVNSLMSLLRSKHSTYWFERRRVVNQQFSLDEHKPIHSVWSET